MLKRITAIILSLVLVLGSAVTTIYASTDTKTSYVYDDVLKTKNYAFCIANQRIYKVNLNTNKVTVFAPKILEGSYIYMKYYKGNLYYGIESGTAFSLYRSNIKTKKECYIASCVDWHYAISNNKIYFRRQLVSGKFNRKVTNLNGTKTKKSKYKAVSIVRDSNAPSYCLIEKEYSDSWKAWLQTPDTKIYLGKLNLEDW